MLGDDDDDDGDDDDGGGGGDCGGDDHSSSERSERFVRFEPNVRSERVRYFSERETNVQALKRLINLIAVN